MVIMLLPFPKEQLSKNLLWTKGCSMATKQKIHVKVPVRSITCPDNKVVYSCKREAMIQAAKSDIQLSPYKCSHCNRWHLTSQEVREKVSPYKQIAFMGYCLTLEDGYWSCPQLPGRVFLEARDIRAALVELHTLSMSIHD